MALSDNKDLNSKKLCFLQPTTHTVSYHNTFRSGYSIHTEGNKCTAVCRNTMALSYCQNVHLHSPHARGRVAAVVCSMPPSMLAVSPPSLTESASAPPRAVLLPPPSPLSLQLGAPAQLGPRLPHAPAIIHSTHPLTL